MSSTNSANASGNKQATTSTTQFSLKEQRKQEELKAKKEAKKNFKKATDPKPKEQVQTATKNSNPKTELKQKNLKAAETAVRESKYKYPENSSDRDKKAFRRKARETRDKFTLAIDELTKSKNPDAKKELQAKTAEFETWKAATYALEEQTS